MQHSAVWKAFQLAFSALTIAGFVVVTASPASAEDIKQMRLSVALEHLKASSSSLTDEDITAILEFPEVARNVPDPHGFKYDGDAAANIVRRLDGRSTAEPSWTQTSLLGSTIYRWKYHVEWTWLGPSKVTGWGSRYDEVYDQQPIINVKDVVSDSAGAIGGATAKTFRKRHIEYCFIDVLGCYANTYPHATITVNGAGKFKASGDAS